jgi:hypothetical protein
MTTLARFARLALPALLSAALGACASAPRPSTLTVRNDSMSAIEVHYAVLAPDGSQATPDEAGIQHMTVDAGGAQVQDIADPTGAIPKAARGSTVLRAFVVPVGAGPEAMQVVDMGPPGPFVLRASPFGQGFKVERETVRETDDRQMRDLTHDEPPQPGRAGRP